MGKRRIPFSTIVAIRLDELPRVAAVLLRHGEMLAAGPWLKVLANTLAAGEETRDPRTPRPYRQLTYSALTYHIERCGVVATDEEIRAAIDQTRAWRQTLAKDGRPWRPLMRADTIGELLGITDAVREEAKAWNLGTYGGTPANRAKGKRERDRMHKEIRRRAAGVISREKYESQSISRAKPWEAEGISRRTWYARRNGKDQVCTSPALHKCGAAIQQALHKSGAAILDEGNNASSRYPLEACGSELETATAAESLGHSVSGVSKTAANGRVPFFSMVDDAFVIHTKRGRIHLVRS